MGHQPIHNYRLNHITVFVVFIVVDSNGLIDNCSMFDVENKVNQIFI